MYNAFVLYVALESLPRLGRRAYHDKDGNPCAVAHIHDVVHAIAGTPACPDIDARRLRRCNKAATGISIRKQKQLEYLNDRSSNQRVQQARVRARIDSWYRMALAGQRTLSPQINLTTEAIRGIARIQTEIIAERELITP